MIRVTACAALLALAGCAPTTPVVKPRIVTVTEYVQVPVPAGLADACRVIEPDPACWRRERAVFCNGQLADMLRDYRLALAECRAGVEALADGQK